ncbi:MAG: hypothetical protein E6K67_06790, partial [Nitrospirae bacterium]
AVRIQVGSKSDVGRRRSQNEDSLCVDRRLGLFVVCDGMGGHNAGEVASRLACDIVREHVREALQRADLPFVGQYDPRFSASTNRLASAVRFANDVVYRAANSRLDYEGWTAWSSPLRTLVTVACTWFGPATSGN